MDEGKLKGRENSIRVGVIVCSDRARAGEYTDRATAAAVDWLEAHGYSIAGHRLVSDEPAELVEALVALAGQAEVLVISGGTGLGPRDVTPQTLERFCDYPVPGIGERLRAESLRYSANAYLSRCGGYVKEGTLYLALPGNPKAVTEQLSILESLLPSAVAALKGQCQHR